MRKRSRVTHEEIIADLVFVGVSGIISFLITFLFDVHHSFYNWPIFPLKYIFQNPLPYVIFTLLGALFGFFIIKVMVFGIHEGERKRRKR